MSDTDPEILHARMANAIRALSMDAVEAAKSGHPGLPMGAADIATVLFTEFVDFDPKKPDWPDRDRFVLSAGHGSMLIYSVLHLLGVEGMPIDEIRNFRQFGSKTPGHPEYGHTPGVETTTGPLGQGIATAVGMALAEKLMAARFGKDLVDHYTYVLASDGDLMEGISHEAISFAGHLRLNKLIVLFDDNSISIDGPTDLSESTDQIRRFEAAGWRAERIDGHDRAAISRAISEARDADRPTLIACRTTIGHGAPPKAGTAAAHGAPLGADEIAGARETLDWPHTPFEIPSDVYDAWRIAGLKRGHHRRDWEARLEAADMDTRATFERVIHGNLPNGLGDAVAELKRRQSTERPDMATRKASQVALEAINPVVTETIGGSADLTGSNNTKTPDLGVVTAEDFSGRFIHYGVREHGMAAAMNGMALHRGLIPYSGTFLVFSDYCRPAIRLAALMEQRVIHVMTHDSIGLGEDGPTHQPVEHLASLRAMPNTLVLRPADAVETAECWQIALENTDGPSILVLTRQNLPTLRTEHDAANLSTRGAYEIVSADNAQVSLFATGSEVAIAVDAAADLARGGITARVVSMPSFELFDRQSDSYRDAMIGEAPVKIAVEAAVRLGWDRIIGPDGIFVGMTGFGASAPYKTLYEEFGITAEAIAGKARAALNANT